MTTALARDIAELVADLKATKLRRELCQTCPLYPRPVVVLDTNAAGLGPVDVAFVGLNPGTVEARQDRPFIGPAGQLLRAKLSMLPPGSTWLITNILLCQTPNEAAIPNPAKAIAHCRPFMGTILKRLPPRLMVPVGAAPAAWAGVKEPITKASGRLQAAGVLPLIHPSAVRRFPGRWGALFEESFAAVVEEMERARDGKG